MYKIVPILIIVWTGNAIVSMGVFRVSVPKIMAYIDRVIDIQLAFGYDVGKASIILASVLCITIEYYLPAVARDFACPLDHVFLRTLRS